MKEAGWVGLEVLVLDCLNFIGIVLRKGTYWSGTIRSLVSAFYFLSLLPMRYSLITGELARFITGHLESFAPP
ncbi:MAG: hypothetical protein AMR96_01465 [Candidatus Adiutrix intracellularis]|nr:MAG: hypothetical protein AMR96_01465 [Candidatus Adiutrix intracellularis]